MTTTTKSAKAKAKTKVKTKVKKQSRTNAEFKTLVDSLYGSMSWLNVTVADYLREKHAETDAENGD